MHADGDEPSGAIIGSALSILGIERVARRRQPIRPIRVHLRASACICVRSSFLRPCTWHARWGPGAADPAALPSYRLAPRIAISDTTKRDVGETRTPTISHHASRPRTPRNETTARCKPSSFQTMHYHLEHRETRRERDACPHRLAPCVHSQPARNETPTRHAPSSSHSIPTPSLPMKRDTSETQPNAVSPHAHALNPHETRRRRDTGPRAFGERGPASIPTRIARPHPGHGRTMTTLRALKPPCRGQRRTARPDSRRKVSALPRPARSDRRVRPHAPGRTLCPRPS